MAQDQRQDDDHNCQGARNRHYARPAQRGAGHVGTRRLGQLSRTDFLGQDEFRKEILKGIDLDIPAGK